LHGVEQISYDRQEGRKAVSRPQTSGLIVSLSEPIIDRIFHHRDTYVHPNSEPSKFLQVGNRIFFYDILSKNLIGEAVITKLVLEKWDNLAQLSHNLFLSADELEQYAGEKGLDKHEPVLVLELEEAVKYMNPMKCPISIPSSGLRVTSEVFNEITSANG
jgi:hypothetical protein